MVIWVVGQPACLVPRPPLASSILQLWVARAQTYHHAPRDLLGLETALNNYFASKLLNRKSTCIKSFCHMMNYDTSLCSQNVHSLRAPIIGNICLFRRYVSYLALSNSNDVDSYDNSECTHVRVCTWCVIWNVCSYSFICHLDVRLFVARWFHYLHPPPVCSAALPALCVQYSPVWILLCCLLCEPWCTWCSLCCGCGYGISNWCHHCTSMWHLISVIFIDLHRFSVEKTQHFK